MKEIKDNMPALDFLSGGGEMGERIRNFDWSKTSLGHPEIWENSLKTCVRIMLTSQQPMFVWWGDELICLYNDAYRTILGNKHPASLGISGKIAWKEIWDQLSIRVKTVFEKNEGTFDDALLLLMNRNGYDEETYFKFSYNPIPGTKKTTEGLFCVCTEETQRIINERAFDTIRELGAITFEEKSLDIIYRNVAEALGKNSKDFPFALVYKITATAITVAVAATTGIDKTQTVFPASIDITKPTAITKDFCEAFRENKVVVSDIKVENITLPTGAWETTPKQFIYLPVSPAGGTHPYCIISAALNPYRKFDETYLQFCKLIGDRISIEINKMLALELELKRAEVLAEIDRAKTVFFSNISHEFRTPLTLMLSPLEEVLNQEGSNLSKSDKQNIETAQRNSLRLLKLVNNLLDFSGIEKGRQQAMFTLLDIALLTKNLAANFRAIIEKAGMKLVVKTDTNIQHVYVDKQMWEKIVFNLLSNAFKYTLEGSITVELTSEEDFVILKIKDTGVGIPENELPKMFQRFHRVHNAAGRTFEGSGIGLSLIKELVLLHHGEITVDSVLNKGSVFTVKIPFGKKHVTENQILKTEKVENEIASDIYAVELETLIEKKVEATETPSVKEKNIQPTILVVDDNADMREHIKSLLSNDFNVITANNGMDALHRMKETTPALVLADIMMPVMDGIGLLKEIKSNTATATIPVIFLTARAGEESRIAGLETGAEDYLVKPFSSKELLTRVKAQIKLVKLRKSLQGNLRNLFSDAPALICVLRGPQHEYEHANKMYLQLTGNRNIIGKPIRQALPELEGQGFFEILDNVYSTGDPFIGKEIPARLDKGNGKVENVYVNFVYQPSHDSEGEIDGIFVHGVDVTEQVLARKKIEESKNQLQNIFLNAPAAICILEGSEHKYILANKAYKKLTNRKEEDLLEQNLREVFPELIGTGAIELFDNVFETGATFNFPEYALILDLKNDGVLRQAYFNFSLEPLKNDSGKIYAVMSMAYDITEQVLARKKIEEIDKYQAFLLKISDTVRPLHNPEDIEGEITKIALDYIDADWCHYSTIEEDNIIIKRDATRGDLPSLVGVYPISSFALFKTALNGGLPLIIDDVHTTDLLDEELKQICIKLQSISFILIPVIKNDKPVGLFSVVQSKRRKWTPSEVQLTIETAERTWAAVERAKAEEALNRSEEKYRTLFDSIDEGFSLVEMLFDDKGKAVDYIFLEMNNAHEAMSGLSIGAVGMHIRELMPDIEESVLENMGKVALTGESIRYEQYVSALDRWFDIYSLRVGGNDSRTVATVFNNITERKRTEEKIKESESRFRTMADSSPVLIWTLDANNLSAYYNKTFLDFIGVSKNEDISDWAKIVHPDDVQYTLDTINTAISEHRSFSLELRLLRADGQWRWVLAQGNPRLGANNEFLGFVGSSVDIDDRKQAEEKVIESEERFKTLADDSPMFVFLIDPDPQAPVSYNNKTWLTYTGLNAEEASGMGWNGIMHPDDIPVALECYVQALTSKQPYFIPAARLKRYDGVYRWHSFKGNPRFLPGGEFNGYVGVGWDIHEQKLAQEKIKESEEQFRNLIFSSPSAIGILQGEDLIITIANYPIIEIWGKGKEIIGKKYFDALPELVEQGYKEVFAQVYKTGIPFTAIETPVSIVQNGETILKYYNFILYPQRNSNNEINGIGIIATEVTSQAVLNNKLKESEKLLEQKVIHRTQQLNEKNIELQKMNKDLEAFTFISSHDLQEPIRKIKNFVSCLVDEEKERLSVAGKHYLERTYLTAQRMQNLILDLLTYSRVETSEQKFEKTDLNIIVNEVKDDLKEAAEETGAVIEADDLCELNINQSQLQQLFNNLIGNSLKFKREGVKLHIVIKSEISDGKRFNNDLLKDNEEKLLPDVMYCHISVSDNGIGFDPEYKYRIFEVFQRLHEYDQFKGTGIGLAICKKIVENHKGIITATGKVNAGATFDIYLPVE